MTIKMQYGRDHGEVTVDHSNSPGVPDWMAIMAGFDPALLREGKVARFRTLCCAHCKVHVVPNHRRIERASCPKCDHHYICDLCAFRASMPDYDHTPFEKMVDLTLSGKQPLGSPRKASNPIGDV